MFWRVAGLSTASPVETILDKETFTLEELLDEDEIIQECKALNSRLINFLRERVQVEQLLGYIVEEAPENADKRRTFKFPFIACEIFTCEIDIILKALVEDEELMNFLFSFLQPQHSHSTLLAGYFSKVVICLLLRKTVPFMSYIQAHQEIFRRLVDLIGITSIMEVLIRLVGADEALYANCMESMQWLEGTDVLEMIVDKFSSADSAEVHANAAETLCAITRYAPPWLAAKVSSPSFIGRLFCHALEDSRPKSVLVNFLSVCISLLDPKGLTLGTYHTFNRQLTHGSTAIVSPETVEGMLERLGQWAWGIIDTSHRYDLTWICIDGIFKTKYDTDMLRSGDLLKLLEFSFEENMLLTTYGKLQPPLGKHRLKIIEFISVLLTVSSEAAERELIRLRAVKHILDLFFEYPYNNFLHHHVEHIIMSCLESKNSLLIEHLLHDCSLVGKILEAENNFTLVIAPNKPTVPTEGRSPPRIGNIGHLTRISNKLVQLGNSNIEIQAYLQDNTEWADWHTNVLTKRNAVENVYQWACGRPTTLQDHTRDSDDDDYQDRDYDVAALANNLSQAFRYGIYGNDSIDEAHGSLGRGDEDVYFDDESAEVVISSLRLGDDQESGSLFTNSDWFAFGDDRILKEWSTGTVASLTLTPDTEGIGNGSGDDEVMVDEDGLVDTATSQLSKPKLSLEDSAFVNLSQYTGEAEVSESDKPPEWVEWRETSDSLEPYDADRPPVLPNDDHHLELENQADNIDSDTAVPSSSSTDALVDNRKTDAGELPDECPGFNPSQPSESEDVNQNSDTSPHDDVKKPVGTEGCSEVVET